MVDFAFECGDLVRYTVVPEFVGTVVARTEWINGCLRYTVQGKELKDGLPTEPMSLDEAEMALVGQRLAQMPKERPPAAPAGGPKRGERSITRRR